MKGCLPGTDWFVRWERKGGDLGGRILVGLVKAEDKEEDYHVLEPLASVTDE
jgi:hypothetical protein